MKQSNQPKTKSPVFSKKFFFAFILPILLFGIIFVIFAVRDFIRLDVAFYDIDKFSENAITSFIKENFSKNARFSVLTDKEAKNPARVSRQYDFVFCSHGLFSERVSTNAQTFPESFFELIPTSSRLRCKNKKQIPVLLNHYEFVYLKSALRDANRAVPETADEFDDFLSFAKGKFSSPIFLAGNDDAILLSFIGALVESEAGSEAYEKFISLIKENSAFEKMYQTPFAKKNGNAISLETILFKIDTWQKNGFLIPDWISADKYDVERFMYDKFTGAVFMSLDMHRFLLQRIVDEFSEMHFPFRNSADTHAIIAPPLMMIQTAKREKFLPLAKKFLLPDSQEYLSNMSQLAPAALQGTATDKQADDIRFWAASLPAGPFSGPDKEAFLTKSDAKIFANAIREYLHFR